MGSSNASRARSPRALDRKVGNAALTDADLAAIVDLLVAKGQRATWIAVPPVSAGVSATRSIRPDPQMPTAGEPRMVWTFGSAPTSLR